MMFNKFQLSLLSGAIALAACGSAFAQATPAEFKVIGEFVPPSCTVTTTSNGEFDYGTISPTIIGSSAYNLGKQKQTLTVDCGQAQTYLLFQATDDAVASVSSTGISNYGLGMVNTSGKLGYYTLNMQNVMADGAIVRVGYGGSGVGVGLSACYASSDVYNAGYKMAWCSQSAVTPMLAKVFTADFETTAYLNTVTGMNGAIKDDVKLAGATTLTFQFAL